MFYTVDATNSTGGVSASTGAARWSHADASQAGFTATGLATGWRPPAGYGACAAPQRGQQGPHGDRGRLRPLEQRGVLYLARRDEPERHRGLVVVLEDSV